MKFRSATPGAGDPVPSEPAPIAQACAVPFRRTEDGVEVCLVTSLKKKRWIFPKGIIDAGETLHGAALKEALEEAGVRGRLLGEPLGSYQGEKWGTTIDVTAMLMEATHWDERWAESHLRERRWVRPHEAMTLLANPELKEILVRAQDRFAATG